MIHVGGNGYTDFGLEEVSLHDQGEESKTGPLFGKKHGVESKSSHMAKVDIMYTNKSKGKANIGVSREIE